MLAERSVVIRRKALPDFGCNHTGAGLRVALARWGRGRGLPPEEAWPRRLASGQSCAAGAEGGPRRRVGGSGSWCRVGDWRADATLGVPWARDPTREAAPGEEGIAVSRGRFGWGSGASVCVRACAWQLEAALLPSPPVNADREPAPPADGDPSPESTPLLPFPKGTSSAPSPGREGALWAHTAPF